MCRGEIVGYTVYVEEKEDVVKESMQTVGVREEDAIEMEADHLLWRLIKRAVQK